MDLVTFTEWGSFLFAMPFLICLGLALYWGQT